MSSIREEAAFLAKVKRNTKKNHAPSVAPKGKVFVTKLLFIAGYFSLFIGFSLAITFILIMESTFSDIGGANAGVLVEQISAADPGVQALVSSLGLSWIPTFIKIYAIRWPIALGAIAFFGAIALIVFSIAISRKKKYEV